MAPVTRKRISYVLPLNSDSHGHRLGVNALALDDKQSILYSAGRDGVICAWNVSPTGRDFDRSQPKGEQNAPTRTGPAAIYRQHIQAHTHWINDLCLIQNQSALASASSDVSVKIWRPYAHGQHHPQTIGVHSDYVKRVATPSDASDWIAAGGLDRKVSLWDVNGGGQRLQIDVADEEAPAKGSVYALACNASMIATGGPESVVKLWDPRSGQRITKFVGHTDNIRDVLISRDNDLIMTASSDKTVKLWSLTAGRCIHTLGMHNDSVWCLKSSHPHLSAFYSGDRSGYVVKTDLRGLQSLDDGVSIAITQEHEGINNLSVGQGVIWTATASSSINSWQDANLAVGVQIPDTMKAFRWNNSARSRGSVASNTLKAQTSPTSPGEEGSKIPFSCVLRLSNMIAFPGVRLGPPAARQSLVAGSHARKASLAVPGSPDGSTFAPLRAAPVDTIEGQDGLIKHVVLNDKQRVLTLDTTGEVVLWDLLKCTQVKSFGKRSLDEVASESNEQTSIARWCNVDTRTGTLTCTIDEQRGFDAEIYLDDTDFAKDIEFREDQRINIGRWVLLSLFATFLDEEQRRDDAFRNMVSGTKTAANGGGRQKPAMTLDLPSRTSEAWNQPSAGSTPRAANGFRNAIMTPGLAIGMASVSPALPSTAQPGEPTSADPSRPSMEGGRPSDYFSQPPTSNPTQRAAPRSSLDGRKTPSETPEEKVPASPVDLPKTPQTPGRFGKFLSGLNKTGKKKSQAEDAKTSAQTAEEGTAPGQGQADTKQEESPTTFRQVVERLRTEYTSAISKAPDGSQLTTLIIPAPPAEVPVLRPPPGTMVLIQEERPERGGAADLFEGRIEDLGRQVDLIEAIAPAWLADVLLKNRTPAQPNGYNKLKFILEPVENQLPWICKPDRTEHLNANRMLRARKMAAYVAEKLEPPEPGAPGAEPDPNAPRPETYIDLYCNNQLLTPKTTLAWMKSNLWRGSGGELIVQYKANGRKRIVPRGPELIYLGAAAVEQATVLREGAGAAAAAV